MITVRLWQGLMVGLVAVGLAGCTNSASTPGSSGTTGPAPGSSGTTGPAPASSGTTRPASAQASPLPSGAIASARAAARQFDNAYFASKYAASWNLLSPKVKRQVPENVWATVHKSCPAATSGVTREIKAVIVFGTTAIVTETVRRANSSQNTVENVFYYASGHWGYEPVNPGIYHGRSISADIAAAKAAGLCVGWKTF
jgi:hypothetical protein